MLRSDRLPHFVHTPSSAHYARHHTLLTRRACFATQVEDLARMRITVPPHAVAAGSTTGTFCSANLGKDTGIIVCVHSWSSVV